MIHGKKRRTIVTTKGVDILANLSVLAMHIYLMRCLEYFNGHRATYGVTMISGKGKRWRYWLHIISIYLAYCTYATES